MNKELEELKKQRKELDRKIRELTNAQYLCGFAKIGVERYPTGKPDRYYLAVNTKADSFKESWRYSTIFNGHSVKEVVEAMPGIIKDLQTLYDRMQKGDLCGTN